MDNHNCSLIQEKSMMIDEQSKFNQNHNVEMAVRGILWIKTYCMFHYATICYLLIASCEKQKLPQRIIIYLQNLKSTHLLIIGAKQQHPLKLYCKDKINILGFHFYFADQHTWLSSLSLSLFYFSTESIIINPTFFLRQIP